MGQHHQELLQQGRVLACHAQHVLPETSAGIALDALAPDHGAQRLVSLDLSGFFLNKLDADFGELLL